jgi:DNA invertase Pin-like site-specific DNA recombinase
VRNIISAYPDVKIYEETYTGTEIAGRKEFKKLLNVVKAGDTIIFDSVSRMSRNASEGIELYEKLFDEGINLVFLKEQYINTDVYRSKLENINIPDIDNKVFEPLLKGLEETLKALAREQIEIAFNQAEKEVMDLRQRTKEGIETARRNGKKIGVQPGTKRETKRGNEIKEIIKAYSKEFNGTSSDKQIMELNKIGRNSYYRHKKELLELKGE